MISRTFTHISTKLIIESSQTYIIQSDNDTFQSSYTTCTIQFNFTHQSQKSSLLLQLCSKPHLSVSQAVQIQTKNTIIYASSSTFFSAKAALLNLTNSPEKRICSSTSVVFDILSRSCSICSASDCNDLDTADVLEA